MKGECQRKLFLPKRLLQRRAPAPLLCLAARSLPGRAMLMLGLISTAPSALCLLTDTSRRAVPKPLPLSADQSSWQECHMSKSVPRGKSGIHLGTDNAVRTTQLTCSRVSKLGLLEAMALTQKGLQGYCESSTLEPVLRNGLCVDTQI